MTLSHRRASGFVRRMADDMAIRNFADATIDFSQIPHAHRKDTFNYATSPIGTGQRVSSGQTQLPLTSDLCYAGRRRSNPSQCRSTWTVERAQARKERSQALQGTRIESRW